MEEYNIDILNLRCPICLDIFKNPYILPCQANCIACFQCICDLFKCAPKPFNANEELQVIAKCICNQDNIPIDKSVPCVGVKRLTKNITIRCRNHTHGCSFFIHEEMEKSLLETHLKICGQVFNLVININCEV